jgi:unsaturated rhamnogalacturonyl hydrolase
MRISPLLALTALVGLPLIRGAESTPALPDPKEVLSLMERVADWQIANPKLPAAEDTENPPRSVEYSPRGWVMGAADTGIMALAGISESPRFVDAMRKTGEKNAWKPGVRIYHADDHCIIQTYAELYFRNPDATTIAPSVARFDYILEHPAPADLEFIGENRNTQWSWCDSLFMAPPAWIRLWKATGKAAYLKFAVTNWWKTSDYLYDKTEHLYFRDSTYFQRREANGAKIFWSRGNGWVVGGLVRVLQYLPADHPARPRFEQQFREMAAKLISIQQPDGFWRSSLLDPEHYPAQEESGTGFYCYGLAWGVNHGLLDRKTYWPAVLKAWDALTSCVQPDGKLIHVQPIGADPKKFDPNMTEPFGVGCFLLAGSEVYYAAGGVHL